MQKVFQQCTVGVLLHSNKIHKGMLMTVNATEWKNLPFFLDYS